MRENQEERYSGWAEIYKKKARRGEHSQKELLSAMVTAGEVKHQKYVSRGLAALMGAAAVVSVERLRINDSGSVITWAENPRLGIAINTAYFAFVTSTAARIKAAVIEHRANDAYKNLKLSTGFSAGQMEMLFEEVHDDVFDVDKESDV